VTLTHAAPGHVAVTLRHGATTVAATALLYCTSTVHLDMPVPAQGLHAGEPLLVTVTVDENRSLAVTEEYVSVS
jgi:hypothetical protein